VETPCRAALRSFSFFDTNVRPRRRRARGERERKRKRKEKKTTRVFFIVCVLISKPDRFETRLIRNPNTNDNRSPVEIAG
jgi:hypothetical protein